MKIFPNYKTVKERKPFCPGCGERLSGNNSIASPYRCSCGVWKPLFTGGYEIISTPTDDIKKME